MLVEPCVAQTFVTYRGRPCVQAPGTPPPPRVDPNLNVSLKRQKRIGLLRKVGGSLCWAFCWHLSWMDSSCLDHCDISWQMNDNTASCPTL